MNQISLLVANYRDSFTLPIGSKILAVHRASANEIAVWVSGPVETLPEAEEEYLSPPTQESAPETVSWSFVTCDDAARYDPNEAKYVDTFVHPRNGSNMHVFVKGVV